MKRSLYTVMVCIGLATALYSCSNGDYTSNATNPSNGSINPLKPLTASEFTWSGTKPMSANINGSLWVADSVVYAIDTSGSNVILGFKGAQALAIYGRNVWTGSVYNMGYHEYNVLAEWYDMDSARAGKVNSFYQSALGNSGELYMVQNDTLNYDGRFYFQGQNAAGQIVNITNGYFKIEKYQ